MAKFLWLITVTTLASKDTVHSITSSVHGYVLKIPKQACFISLGLTNEANFRHQTRADRKWETVYIFCYRLKHFLSALFRYYIRYLSDRVVSLHNDGAHGWSHTHDMQVARVTACLAQF